MVPPTASPLNDTFCSASCKRFKDPSTGSPVAAAEHQEEHHPTTPTTTMPNNPGSLPKMPSAPDVLHSDDPITSGDAEQSINRPQRQLMPALNLSTATPGGTKKIQQKKGKRLRSVYTSENPEGETDRDVLLPSSSASSAADESEFEDATMETPRRRRAHRSSSIFGFSKGQSILQQQMASQATIATNNAILSTV